jgi:hypothetical protein
LERGLPAKNDNAVYLFDRGDWFAGKPRSNKLLKLYASLSANPLEPLSHTVVAWLSRRPGAMILTLRRKE